MDDSRIKKIKTDTPILIEKPSDLLYLTGLIFSKGRLLIGKDSATLFVDGRYFERAKKEAPCPVRLWEEFSEASLKELHFDSSFVTYDGYLSLKKELPHVHLTPKANPLQDLRAIKEPDEIAKLKKAALLTWQGYKHIASLLKEGITEEELGLEFEFFLQEKRGLGSLL